MPKFSLFSPVPVADKCHKLNMLNIQKLHICLGMQFFTAISLLYFNIETGCCKLPSLTIVQRQLLHQRCKAHFAELLQLQRPNSILYQSSCIMTPRSTASLSRQKAIWHYSKQAKSAEAACSIACSLEWSNGKSTVAKWACALVWYFKVRSYSADVLH